MRILGVILTVLCCFIPVQAQRFTSFQCDPVSCQEFLGPIQTGEVWVDGYATCDNWVGHVEVHPNVWPQGCSFLVDLAASVTRSSIEELDDCGNLITTDTMTGSAGAFFDADPWTPYWRMYQIRGCDGQYDDYIQPGATC